MSNLDWKLIIWKNDSTMVELFRLYQLLTLPFLCVVGILCKCGQGVHQGYNLVNLWIARYIDL